MNRVFTCFLIILSIYLSCTYGLNDLDENYLNTGIKTSILDVGSQSRKKGHYYLYPFYSWHALSWIYWIKVKIIVVAFFVGTAFIWGIQYLGKYYQRCPDVGHIYYDHGHYRSFDDPQIPKFLQNLQQSRKTRSLKNI